MKTQKLSHSISKFTPSLAIALLVAFAPYTSALPSSQYSKISQNLVDVEPHDVHGDDRRSPTVAHPDHRETFESDGQAPKQP